MNRRIFSWCLYDFANSSYSAVISAVIFPVYYVNVIVGNEAGQGDLWWGRAIALSMGIVAITSPVLGGIADYAHLRKKLLVFYTLLCVSCVAAFSFLERDMVMEGFLLIVLANFAMEGGLVFYNSYLPEISKKEFCGRVSAWGFGIGYAGSIVSLILAFFLIERGSILLVWPAVALFFLIFSLPAFFFLPPDDRRKMTIFRASISGFIEIWKRFKIMWRNKEQRKFLIAYLIYEDGVNTVIVFSSIFAATTLHFSSQELIIMYLIVQATALLGAFLMARPIDYWGPKKVVSLTLALWMFVSIAAFFILDKVYFQIIAGVAGIGLGTVQAASRAFYTQFIPDDQESEYFGVYSLVGKSSAILGPLLFGFLSTVFSSQRPAILSVIIFFVAGLVLIQTVKAGGSNISKKS